MFSHLVGKARLSSPVAWEQFTFSESRGSNNFLVKSERLLRLCVDDSQLEENATEIERLKVQFVRDLFGTAGSQSSEVATNNLLLGKKNTSIYIYISIIIYGCLGRVGSWDHSQQLEAGCALLPTWLARLRAARCTLLASAPTTRGTTSAHALGDCCGGCWWLGGRNF